MKLNKQAILDITRDAGKAILKVYQKADFSDVVSYKDDNSPLTLADEAAHKVIVSKLSELYPDIPIISEEGKDIDYNVRKDYDMFWLVDPLDGTKEFINRNGEFTVNIALIDNGKPVAGFIYTPVLDTYYYGIKGESAYKITKGEEESISVNNKDKERVAVRSKSHASPEEEDVLEKYNAVDSISVGSSLKFCMVAEGKADIYYRHGPTMEWDTAAGQAILEAAGGVVLKNTGPEPFTYNKENLLNSSFLGLGF
ncbi:3'(2'),5'-bisphosphate nucleotidase [Fulvivirga sp. RKSG066]|uniref:3'(2'),5'-bisphosphate nucleotidase CysQ n=1 Tax=Fulvivirga aurantia TaxID=2529383 RepID=UPI0012BB6B50|nr:3'(2'),5'-bisphosphate nucleotidase CysQ [Fulvivirga aurantia]MTI21594.1 3'(2'),5'-bisphosphate nucleotidase [Fulvivirga aurantia]